MLNFTHLNLKVVYKYRRHRNDPLNQIKMNNENIWTPFGLPNQKYSFGNPINLHNAFENRKLKTDNFNAWIDQEFIQAQININNHVEKLAKDFLFNAFITEIYKPAGNIIYNK